MIRGSRVGQVFPEELATVDDFAATHVKEIDGQPVVFKVIAEDVGIVILLGGGDALLLLELVHGGELIAEARGGFKLLGCCCGHHARGERRVPTRRDVPSRKSCASRTAC